MEHCHCCAAGLRARYVTRVRLHFPWGARPVQKHLPAVPTSGWQPWQHWSLKMLHAVPVGQQALSDSGSIASASGMALSADVSAAGSAFGPIALAVIEVDMTAMKAASRETMIRRAFRFDEFTVSSR